MTAHPANPIMELDRVAFSYPGRPALFRELDFSLREGERLGLLGANGSGKTTFLRILLGLEAPAAGRVLYRGEDTAAPRVLQALRRAVGLVLQNSDDQVFSATVLEDVAFGPLNLGLDRRAARDRSMEALEELAAAGLASRATHRLSAGEKKLTAVAGVLAMAPEAVLLDEPTAGLDAAARERVCEALLRRTAAMIVVSHDTDFLRRVAAGGRLVGIEAGRIVEVPPADGGL